MTAKKIVVVGAGIVGSSIAYHLAARGQQVTVLEANLPGSGATHASFAWIGRPVSDVGPSGALRMTALNEYRRLQSELPEISINWSGALLWEASDDTSDDERIENVSSLEPNLVSPPASVFYKPDDAGFDPRVVVDQLMLAAIRNGAELRVGTPVVSLQTKDRSITGVRTTEGVVTADTVILTAGTGAVPLCLGVGIELPVKPSPAVLVRLRTTPGLVRKIVAQRDLEVRQQSEDTLLAAVSYCGETSQVALNEVAERIRRRIAERFGAAYIEIQSVEVGWRPMPEDGEPIVGYHPDVSGLYLAVMHSAITLGAAIGRLVSEEVVEEAESELLDSCRLQRFQKSVA